MNLKYILLGGGCLLLACTGQKEENDATGRFEATEVVVSAKVNGDLMRFDVKEGQEVEPGVELGYVDTVNLALQREQLLANLSSTDSRYINEQRQLAALRQQIDNLKTERQRFEYLVKSKAATEKQLDDINYQIAVMERQLAARVEEIGNANASLGGQSAAIGAQVAQVDHRIRNSVICSPMKGTVVEKYTEQGEYTAPGRPLFKVADLSEMTLRAYFSADQLAEIKLGQQVKVLVDAADGKQKTYAGVVEWISEEAEFTPKTIQTRDERANLVYAVNIRVKNDGFIKRGMYGEVKL